MTPMKARETKENMLLCVDCRTVINKHGKCKYYLKKEDNICGEQRLPTYSKNMAQKRIISMRIQYYIK